VPSQAAQAAAPVPHVAIVGVLQALAWQQPEGHDDASQTQVPPTQCCPSWHAGPPPQRQAPITAQVSDLAASQIMQAAAPVPQVLSDRG
jgi:hypothetical protein